jgi:PAS domain S-box-containing protein
MGGNPELATWLVSRRREIEREMSLRLGPAAPAAADPESEALRRFRSFAASALRRGAAAAPAMEGVRAHERRVLALLRAWTEAAEELAGERGRELRGALDPLVDRFRLSLRTTRSRQRASGQPRASRRAVVAAIDRVADAFFAVDTESGEIADANPAAGALLGVARDALLGVSALSFVAEAEREILWGELDAVCESEEPRHFRCALRDRSGTHVSVDASATAFTSRGRTLALLLARPRPLG